MEEKEFIGVRILQCYQDVKSSLFDPLLWQPVFLVTCTKSVEEKFYYIVCLFFVYSGVRD